MNVLSLFDGMSCGQLALKRAGVTVDNYFASEINKAAIEVTTFNFPNTVQLGSVTDVKGADLPKIDLLIGGSPCQGFSSAGKGLNFEDPRSILFFEYVRLLKECNPRFFLLENVNMKKEWQAIISDFLGCQPIYINSRLFSAQDRKRLYWTNIPVGNIPVKNVSWLDICSDGFYAGAMRGRRVNDAGKRNDYNTNLKLVQYIESRKDNKTNCLTTVRKDNVATKIRVGRTRITEIEYRYFTRNEMERLQTVPDNYTSCVSLNKAAEMLGNGWTVDVIAHIFRDLDLY